MASTCVVGLQWGDEAKGKIVDLLTADHDIVVRYNGGANAGHTIVKNGKTYKLSLLPTGILSAHMQAVIGNGLVVNPVRFLEEVKNLRDAGITVGDNLILSDHAHLIFPYHVEEEQQGSGAAIGTTGALLLFFDVIGKNQVGVIAQDEIVADGDAGVAQVLDLFEKADRIDDQ